MNKQKLEEISPCILPNPLLPFPVHVKTKQSQGYECMATAGQREPWETMEQMLACQSGGLLISKNMRSKISVSHSKKLVSCIGQKCNKYLKPPRLFWIIYIYIYFWLYEEPVFHRNATVFYRNAIALTSSNRLCYCWKKKTKTLVQLHSQNTEWFSELICNYNKKCQRSE